MASPRALQAAAGSAGAVVRAAAEALEAAVGPHDPRVVPASSLHCTAISVTVRVWLQAERFEVAHAEGLLPAALLSVVAGRSVPLHGHELAALFLSHAAAELAGCGAGMQTR